MPGNICILFSRGAELYSPVFEIWASLICTKAYYSIEIEEKRILYNTKYVLVA